MLASIFVFLCTKRNIIYSNFMQINFCYKIDGIFNRQFQLLTQVQFPPHYFRVLTWKTKGFTENFEPHQQIKVMLDASNEYSF